MASSHVSSIWCCAMTGLLVADVLAANAGSTSVSRGTFLSSQRHVTTEEVAWSLQESLSALLGGDAAASQQLAVVEASVWQTFQALPKNALGRLAPRSVRHIVHTYFAKEHGWLIKGLEPHAMQFFDKEVHEVSILQDKAPGMVEALLESRQSNRGLSLEDVAVMIVALERLIFDESLSLLNASYFLNGRVAGSDLEEQGVHDVLTSYLMVFGQGSESDLTDVSKHEAIKAYLTKNDNTGFSDLVDFERDTVLNFDYETQHRVSPFSSRTYSFDVVSTLMERMTQGYGKWQDAECRHMKAALMDLAPEGSGKVPLGVFYSQPPSALYQFTESAQYLRDTGALDESVPGAPQVRISNYMLGPSNCIASSSYYSICCLSECEVLQSELEAKIMAPQASAGSLVRMVGNLSSSSIDAPRELSESLTTRLHSIADRHGGEVPLHGRLFKEWLHYAFPNECPYPELVETEAVLTQTHWDERRSFASDEERSMHIESVTTAASTNPADVNWSDDEVLPFHEPTPTSAYARYLRPAVQLVMIFVILRMALGSWVSAMTAKRGGHDMNKKTEIQWELPVHC